MQVAYLAEDIPLQVEDEVVRETFRWGLHFDSRRFGVLTRILHLIDVEVGDQFLVPADEVDVTVEVATGHLVASWTLSLARKDDDIVKVAQLGPVDTLQ